MPSFMPIGLKLWALEGYIGTDRQSYFNNIDIDDLKEVDFMAMLVVDSVFQKFKKVYTVWVKKVCVF